MRLTDFERAGAAFCSALDRERYLNGAGLKPTLDLDPIFDDYRWLTDPETFHALRDIHLDPPLDEQYRRFLLAFAASTSLTYGARQQTQALAAAEATRTIAWGERELTYRSVPVVWANEPELERRHELNERWRAVVAELNRERSERHRVIQELVPDLEHGDYVKLWDTLGGLQLSRLAEQMQGLLDSTADLYRDTLRDLLAGHGLTLAEAWKADLAYVSRGVEYDTSFPRERLVPTLVATLRGLGFDLEEQPAIKLDLEPRPAKSPRAFCAPIQIPDDVRLVLRPTGGHLDYATLLHEAGHAEHFANVERTLPFGYRRLGDQALTEGYAFLFQYLMTDSLWLRRRLDFGEPEPFRAFQLFWKLQMLRRYATKLLYETELQRTAEPEPLAERYADLFSHHLLVRYFPEEYLADLDDFFYSVQYLRAWIFEAQLRQFLRREYDEEWFRSPRAGRFIRDLWREGQKYTADQLVKFMGYDELDPGLMLAEIQEALAR